MRWLCSFTGRRSFRLVVFVTIASAAGIFLTAGGMQLHGRRKGNDRPGLSLAQRTDSLLRLAKACRLKEDREGNLRAIRSARRLAERAGDKSRLAEVFAELSRQSLYDESFDQARAYADSALFAARASDVPRAQAVAWLAMAVYCNYLNVRDLAAEHARKALSILDEHDDAYLRARLYYTLYGVYSSWDDAALTAGYARKCVEWAENAGDQDLLSNAWTARSVAMEMRYRETGSAVYLDSMLTSLHRSASLFHRFPERVSNSTYAIANVNIANYYYRYQGLKHPAVRDSVAKYALIARESVRNQDFNYQIRGSVNGLLSELALAAGDRAKAESYLLDSYHRMSEVPAPSYYSLQQTAEALSRLYEDQGAFERSLQFRKKKEEFRDKIFDQSQIQQAHKLEAEFRSKQLQRELAVVKERASSRRTRNFLYGGVTLLALISLILLYQSYRSRNQLHAEQRLRLEKEALADALQIERKNQLFLQLKEQLARLDGADAGGAIDKIIRNELRNEATLQRKAKEFREIRPEFFRKLKELSQNRLTPLDLKYCAYIHLSLSAKEMAAIFNIEPKSIRVSKYRIKQKLELSREQDLDTFLQDLV